jgi:hypothetical protein
MPGAKIEQKPGKMVFGLGGDNQGGYIRIDARPV